MSETMLERAAKAAWLDLRTRQSGWTDPVELATHEAETGYVLDTWPDTQMSVDADGFRSAARAALMAIRDYDRPHLWTAEMQREWQNDIDAILQEKPE